MVETIVGLLILGAAIALVNKTVIKKDKSKGGGTSKYTENTHKK